MLCEASRIRVLVLRGREINLLLVQERSRRLLVRKSSRAPIIRARDKLGLPDGRTYVMFPLPAARTYEEGLPSEARIPRFWDSAIPISGRTGEDTFCSSTP